MPTRARRSKLPVIPHREGITLPPGRPADGGLDQRGGYRIAAVTVAYGPQRLSRHRRPPRSGNPRPYVGGGNHRHRMQPGAVAARQGTPRALSTRRSRFSARAAPGTGRSNSVARAGQSRPPSAAGTSQGNAVKLAEIRLLHIGAGYRGQSGLGQRNGSRQRQRSRRERGGAQELLHACYNRRADEAVHKAPVRHRPANGLLSTAPDGLARPVRSSAEGSGTSQPTMHVPHRSPGSALIKLAQSYASPPPRTADPGRLASASRPRSVTHCGLRPYL